MTRRRVLLTDRAWPGTEVEAGLCDAAGYDLVEAPPGATEDGLAGLAAGVDGILTCWAQVTAKVIAASLSLRVVSRMGIGLDNIDLAAAAARRVAVTRVPDYCVEEVSDHVLGLLHAWARCILTAGRDVRAGVWDPGRYAPRRVSSLVTGVWGLGPTGRRTAAKLTANPLTAQTMSEHIDLDCSGLLSREYDLSEAGDRLMDICDRTINGRLTCAETLGHREFVLTRLYQSA